MDDPVTIFMQVPRGEVERLRTASSLMTDYPRLVEAYVDQMVASLADVELPEPAATELDKLLAAFQVDNHNARCLLAELVPYLVTAQISDPKTRKAVLQ